MAEGSNLWHVGMSCRVSKPVEVGGPQSSRIQEKVMQLAYGKRMQVEHITGTRFLLVKSAAHVPQIGAAPTGHDAFCALEASAYSSLRPHSCFGFTIHYSFSKENSNCCEVRMAPSLNLDILSDGRRCAVCINNMPESLVKKTRYGYLSHIFYLSFCKF